jgi:hypothetical protein
MSQKAEAVLEQIRALEPEEREWLDTQLLIDDNGKFDDLTEDPVFYEEMVRRLNDTAPTLSWEEHERILDEKIAEWNRSRTVL